ncbi:hypothetical protein Pint_25934 [Pistacia integerrima]|uniref:Uncharacterized protein n=1 Tax=Pistacia integerrima TaxID=434235 RepID=A0ACC0YCT8_9ROSI|nr:hypothetical protein Pint_25934 [Pistacia integerrima]
MASKIFPEIQTNLARAILGVSISITLPLVPFRLQYGRDIPIPIFEQNPPLISAFVISAMFSFAGATGVLLVGNKPRLAKLGCFYFIISVASVGLALLILVYALIIEYFKIVSPWAELKKWDGAASFCA